MKGYNFTPDYPSGLESNAYEFAGWYTTPGCFDGSEVDWDTMTMPAGDLMLYAKWTPKTHTVRTFLTKDAVSTGTPINTWENVAHRSTIAKPDAPTNGNYTFVGWFYKENGVEKAFDFSMAITKDMDLYAKWSSNVLVEYTIKYQLENGTTIADDTKGSALAEPPRPSTPRAAATCMTATARATSPRPPATATRWTSTATMSTSLYMLSVHLFPIR